MPSMIELLLNSQGSSPLSQLSSQFGLSEEQTRQAVEALAPALSIGLKRNVSSPMGAGAFVEALASGRHAQYADDPTMAVSSEGVAEGNKILGHLLGSKDVSRAVTAQAASATGIGQSSLKKLLPVLASMVMGSMFKGAKQGAAGGSGGILGKIMEGVLGGGGASPSAPQRRTSDGENPLGRMFEDMLSGRSKKAVGNAPKQRRTTDEGSLGEVFEDMLGSGTRTSRNQPTSIPPTSNPPSLEDTLQPAGDNSLGDMLDAFLDGDDEEPQAEIGGQRRKAPSSGGLTDIFGDMLESGRKPDDPYQNGLESIFDDFMKKG